MNLEGSISEGDWSSEDPVEALRSILELPLNGAQVDMEREERFQLKVRSTRLDFETDVAGLNQKYRGTRLVKRELDLGELNKYFVKENLKAVVLQDEVFGRSLYLGANCRNEAVSGQALCPLFGAYDTDHGRAMTTWTGEYIGGKDVTVFVLGWDEALEVFARDQNVNQKRAFLSGYFPPFSLKEYLREGLHKDILRLDSDTRQEVTQFLLRYLDPSIPSWETRREEQFKFLKELHDGDRYYPEGDVYLLALAKRISREMSFDSVWDELAHYRAVVSDS